MSAPATNDFSPAPVRITTRTLSSCLSSRIARRRSSSVWVLSAFSTFGRLIVTIAVAPSRSISRLSKAITVGTGYISQPSTIAEARNPPNIKPPNRS